MARLSKVRLIVVAAALAAGVLTPAVLGQSGERRPIKPRFDANTALTPATINPSGGVGDASPAFRRYGHWRSGAVGGGGYVQGVRVAPSDPQIVYSWNDVGGLHRSDDGGRTWHALHGNLPTARANYYVGELSVDPRDANKLVVTTGYRYEPATGVFVSDDGGRTFRQTLRAMNATLVDRWAGNTLGRDAGDPGRLVTASTADGVYESLDDGGSWREIGLRQIHPRDLDLDASNPQRMWVVAGKFEEWMNAEYAQWLPKAPSGKTRLRGGLYRTADDGASWQELAGEEADFWQLIQDPQQPDTLYAIADKQATVRRSIDGGTTWQAFTDGLTLEVPPTPWQTSEGKYQMLAAGPDFVLCGSSNGTVYRLDAGGTRWGKIERQSVDTPADWWGSTPEHPTFGADYSTVFQATNSLSIDPADAAHWYMTDWFSIYQTRDAGRTWTWTTDGLEDTYAEALEGDPSDSSVVHLGFGDIGYFRSTDGGAAFGGRSARSVITNNVRSISVPASRPTRVYATGPTPPGGGWWAGVAFVSDDKGQSWRVSPMNGLPEMSEAKHHGNTILSPDAEPQTAYLCVSGAVGPGGGGLYRSDDAGDNWTWQDAGLPAGAVFFRADIWGGGDDLALGSDGSAVAIRGYKEGESGGANIYFRPAGQTNFRAADSDLRPRDVQADPHHAGRFYLACQDNGLYRSDDGGRTWRKLATPEHAPKAYNVIVDRARPDRLAAATANGHILSVDGGETWIELDKSIPHRVGFGMGAFAGDRLVVGTGGSGVYWIDVSDPAAVAADPNGPNYDTRP